MAVLAGAGYHKVKVASVPNVAIIASGSELVVPHQKPEAGKIRNSNSSQLISQLRKINLQVNLNKLVVDNYDELTQTFIDALKYNDILFFTGGASFGDFDFIPEILKDQNFTIYWNTTGMKPGNPMSFSQKEKKYCFGLSGNPVSSLVQFEFIAKPAIYRLLGANYHPLRIKAKMNFDYFRKKADRFAVVPVYIGNDGTIEEIAFHGSAHINALTSANALLEIPLGTTSVLKEEMAYVRPL
jgi:molybdopterin molybdotransferase